MEETASKYNNYVFIESVKHGASVGIPIDYQQLIHVKFVDSKDFSDEMKNFPDIFNPYREVVDLDIRKDKSLDDTIVLRVYYSQEDKDNLDNPEYTREIGQSYTYRIIPRRGSRY